MGSSIVPMRSRLVTRGVLFLAMVGMGAAPLLSQAPQPANPELEVFPKHFVLHPGEQIHYQVRVREGARSRDVSDYTFAIEAPEIVRSIQHPKGELFIEALRPGRSALVVRTPTSGTRINIEVTGPAQPPLMAVPYITVKEIKAKEFLFVGHANLDGFDHTAVAKPGIDRLVQDAKKNGVPVVYFVSNEYPDWYTADRHPDYALISEGQEHEIYVLAERVTFTGGGFMACTLRNVQMTLHGMVKHGERHINFVFPAQAIWVGDEQRMYPSPMVLLKTLFAGRAGDAEAYDSVVIPFLERVITQFPILGYPPNAPAPPLSDLLKDWNIVVRIGDRFERVYQPGDSNKNLLIEFKGV